MDRTISPLRANLLGLVLVPFVVALFFLPYTFFWGYSSLKVALDGLLSWFLLLLALSIVAHELLHGLGYILVGRVSRHDVSLGVSGISVYAYCHVPLAARVYRVAVMLPGVVLGLLPGLAGIVNGNAGLTVYGTLMCVAALGDVVLLWLIRSVPGRTRVQDHPSAPGCRVLTD